jgi:hypothetical protein
MHLYIHFWGVILGFLKFLKRDKSKDLNLDMNGMDDLDVPPAPPSSSKDYGNFPKLPELPDMPKEDEFPELPELKISDKPKFEKFPMKSSQEIRANMQNIPPGDTFPKANPTRPLFPKPMQSVNPQISPKPLFPKSRQEHVLHANRSPYHHMENVAVRESRELLSHKNSKGPIFIRVERFRNIISNQSSIKNGLKQSEESISRLNQIDENRDKVFAKWQGIMTDLQKKFIFIDKTIFKR